MRCVAAAIVCSLARRNMRNSLVYISDLLTIINIQMSSNLPALIMRSLPTPWVGHLEYGVEPEAMLMRRRKGGLTLTAHVI
jgi:hypothetical protein